MSAALQRIQRFPSGGDTLTGQALPPTIAPYRNEAAATAYARDVMRGFTPKPCKRLGLGSMWGGPSEYKWFLEYVQSMNRTVVWITTDPDNTSFTGVYLMDRQSIFTRHGWQ